jgi:hypothetical protein
MLIFDNGNVDPAARELDPAPTDFDSTTRELDL